MMEVLAGARDEGSADRLRRLLFSFEWIPLDPATDFEGAAVIYRACRRAGSRRAGWSTVSLPTSPSAPVRRSSPQMPISPGWRPSSRCGSTRVEPPES